MDSLKLYDSISFYRKKRGLTQEELAQRLGVSNQAVSKWESAQCCPNISLLPKLADLFGISIDELFGRKGKKETHCDLCPGFVWDDDTIKAFQTIGKFFSCDAVVTAEAKPERKMLGKETVVISGKEYEAAYFGEAEMASWSKEYAKRKFWRLENAQDDFKDKPLSRQVLPYDNYPHIEIEIGQIFLVEYERKDAKTERRYYVADGTVWNDLPSTREFWVEFLKAERVDTIEAFGKEYEAAYFGEAEMASWSKEYAKRKFWRLENAQDDFKDKPLSRQVLPYDNYPHIEIEIGQIFLVEYERKDAKTERRYYVADGTVWNDLLSTRQFALET